jgi:hypothetical protein
MHVGFGKRDLKVRGISGDMDVEETIMVKEF